MACIGAPTRQRWWKSPNGLDMHVFKITRIRDCYVDGYFLCNDDSVALRNVESLRAYTATHLLHKDMSLSVPARFLKEWWLPSGAILRAPVELSASDMLVCDFVTKPVELV